MVAMAGMYFTGSSTFSSFATGTIIVVAVAMIGSITVLPALLSQARRPRREGPHPVRCTACARSDGESRVWGAILDRVLARPKTSAVVATALLVVTGRPGVRPEDRRARHGLAAARPRPRCRRSTASRRRSRAARCPRSSRSRPTTSRAPGRRRRSPSCAATRSPAARCASRSQLDVSPDKRVARLALPIVGDGSDARSEHALTTLRDELIPADDRRASTAPRRSSPARRRRAGTSTTS